MKQALLEKIQFIKARIEKIKNQASSLDERECSSEILSDDLIQNPILSRAVKKTQYQHMLQEHNAELKEAESENQKIEEDIRELSLEITRLREHARLPEQDLLTHIDEYIKREKDLEEELDKRIQNVTLRIATQRRERTLEFIHAWLQAYYDEHDAKLNRLHNIFCTAIQQAAEEDYRSMREDATVLNGTITIQKLLFLILGIQSYIKSRKGCGIPLCKRSES